MFKLTAITKKNTAEFSKTDNPMEYGLSVVKKKTRFTLLIIWLIAAAVCGLVFMFNRVSANSDNISLYVIGTNSENEGLFQNKSTIQTQNTNLTDAFVFVNINRKYVITSYPSNMQTEANFTAKNNLQKNRPYNNGTSATKVIKKIKPSVKKQDDFSIKTPPQ